MPSNSAHGADERTPEPQRHADRREHAFFSLLELSRELTFSLDLFDTADLLLFNLMGQLGCSRSALWLLDNEESGGSVLLRSHGFKPEMIRAVGLACHPAIRSRFDEIRAPILAWWLEPSLEPHEFHLLQQASIAVIAPLHARGELLGWIVLGPKVDGTPFDASDLQVLETSLGMVGVSLQSALLFKRVQESNRQLRDTNEHLKELDHMKTQFMSNVNHELRTPITVVIATLECLMDQQGIDSRAESLLKGALEKSQKLQSLVENLLMFNDLANQRLPFELQPVDVAALVGEFADARRPGITADLRKLDCACTERLPHGVADPVRLRHILNELMDNAVKFTPRGTRIQLRVDRVDDASGRWISVELEDNGPGIPPERMHTLFKSFEQVDGSSVRRVGGLGMGLAFVHQLASRMQCRVSARSTVGRGTIFTLLLPVWERPNPSA